jgi:chromosome segregation ATPase
VQARIQTQESQIIECEGALKSRNEELKTLRSESVELTEKCESLESSLDSALGTVEDLREKLAGSEVILFYECFSIISFDF